MKETAIQTVTPAEPSTEPEPDVIKSIDAKPDMTPATEHNCPFYGRHYVRKQGGMSPFILMDQGGNQCAMIVDSYAPCAMQLQMRAIDWKSCTIVQAVML